MKNKNTSIYRTCGHDLSSRIDKLFMICDFNCMSTYYRYLYEYICGKPTTTVCYVCLYYIV